MFNPDPLDLILPVFDHPGKLPVPGIPFFKLLLSQLAKAIAVFDLSPPLAPLNPPASVEDGYIDQGEEADYGKIRPDDHKIVVDMAEDYI